MDQLKKGDKIVLKLRSGECYEGLVYVASEEFGRISLTEGRHYPNGPELESLRHFYSNEIRDITFSNNISQEPEDIKKDEPSSSISSAVHEKIKQLQKGYRLISNITTNFYNAMKIIENSEKIGVCMADTSKGRKFRASVLVISTIDGIFIFDLQTAGDIYFDKGLRNVFQSESIVKIVYDCRLLSDCLKHKHTTILNNVRDVEAEDVVLYQQKYGKIRVRIKHLYELVEQYLGLSCEQELSWDKDLDINKRPLSVEIQNSVVASCSYLIPLHEVIEKKYLERFSMVSELYNTFVRDAPLMEASCMTTIKRETLHHEFVQCLGFIPKVKNVQKIETQNKAMEVNKNIYNGFRLIKRKPK